MVDRAEKISTNIDESNEPASQDILQSPRRTRSQKTEHFYNLVRHRKKREVTASTPARGHSFQPSSLLHRAFARFLPLPFSASKPDYVDPEIFVSVRASERPLSAPVLSDRPFVSVERANEKASVANVNLDESEISADAFLHSASSSSSTAQRRPRSVTFADDPEFELVDLYNSGSWSDDNLDLSAGRTTLPKLARVNRCQVLLRGN